MCALPGPRYEFASVEKRWRDIWEKEGVFSPEYFTRKTEAFCIVVPPPNITGELHVGHALNQTIQDVSTRVARKQGRNTLWLPGTDHAGIATQVHVERDLRRQGIERREIGRDQFIKKVWDWKKKSGDAIQNQQKLLGFSLDWTRERFTMSSDLSLSTREVFVELYNQGLIYRERKIVNWDPESQTVLSELEVEYDENFNGELYSFAYPLYEPKGKQEKSEIVVATTRPETMLGDTAIAVHPQDKRYAHLIGSYVRHPLLERKIQIIGDEILVDPKFGSGAVKLTPAHDPNDFAAAKRHNLEFINIFDERACITKLGGKFAGMDRYVARKAVKKELERLGLMRASQAHTMSVGRSQRSGVIIEPVISTQWFVKVSPLAQKAKEAVKLGEVEILPKQWENTYFHWMDNIRDWCISRQLWWGHRIPAWYGPDEKIFVAKDEKEALILAEKHYKKKVSLRQDPDVLDTWFSSALWPFSTLGWPKKTKDLSQYYPTTLLVTGFDIIFFWVARMIMMGLHFMKKPPFRTVYIHGLMRDKKGKKMSKTIGNVLEPLLTSQQYGTDAFRFFLMATLHEGKDSLYSEQSLRGYQNFTNKIWNSSRFILINLPENFTPLPSSEFETLALESEDYWILSRLNHVIKETTRILASYKFHLSTDGIYTFFWHEFCDWYIELIKPRVFGKSTPSGKAAQQIVYYVMKNAIGLLNPFMPFLTEEIHSFFSFPNTPKKQGKPSKKTETLATSPWPTPLELSKKYEEPIQALSLLQEVTKTARLLRSQSGISPDKKIKLLIRSHNPNLERILKEKEVAIQRLTGSEEIQIQKEYSVKSNESKHAMQPFHEGEVFIFFTENIDSKKEFERIERELKKIDKQVQTSQEKVAKKDFLANAPKLVIEKEKEKLKGFLEKQRTLQDARKHFQK